VGFASSSLALPSADQMVAGVAGRRFLIEMAAKSSAEAHSAVFDMGLALCHGSTGGLERFERDLLRAIDAAQLPREQTEIRAALWRSIQEAVYWEVPSSLSLVANIASLRDALLSLAHSLTDAGSVADAFTPEVGQATFEGQWTPRRVSVTDWRRAWERDNDAFRRLRNRRLWLAGQRRRPLAGAWWSAPLGLPCTSDLWVGGVPALQYTLEDDPGGTDAVSRMVASGPASTLVISDASVWTQLVADYPLVVTPVVADEWGQAFGRDGEWAIPDWEQVAAKWDAVYLPLGVYLACAGQMLEVDPSTATAIAGFAAGTTYWLTEEPQLVPTVNRWVRAEDGRVWVASANGS